MKIPPRMIHQSVRYCLGRRSYAVSECCKWLITNWNRIPENEQAIIRHDIDQQIDMDDRCREMEAQHFPLGDDCDRHRWLKVAELWKEEL